MGRCRLLYRSPRAGVNNSGEGASSMKDNFRELLGVVIALVLLVSLVDVMSMLFLAFTGTSTSVWIWIFAVPSRNVDEDIMCDRRSAQLHLRGVGGMYSEESKTTPFGDGVEKN
jgi:hypothetical protein